MPRQAFPLLNMPALPGHTTVREALTSYGSRCSTADERPAVWPPPRAPPVAGWPRFSAEQRSPFGPVPLQDLHPYYGPLRPCAPHRYSGPLGFFLPIGLLPSHRDDRFSRSIRKPCPASRRLYAGCRSGRLQDHPRTGPERWMHPRFRHHHWHFDTSSAVRFRSPLRTAPDRILSCLLLQR